MMAQPVQPQHSQLPPPPPPPPHLSNTPPYNNSNYNVSNGSSATSSQHSTLSSVDPKQLQQYKLLLNGLNSSDLNTVQLSIAQLEHLNGMGYEHVSICYRLNIIETLKQVLLRYHNNGEVLKHACECYANILHSCIEKKDYKLHHYISTQIFMLIITIVCNSDTSVAASGCRALWNLLYQNIHIYTVEDYKDRINKLVPNLLNLLCAPSQRARQNAGGCLWVLCDVVRPYFIIEIGQRLELIIKSLNDPSTTFETTYILLSLLVALYGDYTQQMLKFINNPSHVKAYRDIDYKLKQRFVRPYNAHMVLINILSQSNVKTATLNKCCDLITNIFWCQTEEQRVFVDSGILRVLSTYFHIDKYNEYHQSYHKLSLAVLAICYQLPTLQQHITHSTDIFQYITQNISKLPSPTNLALALTMCCLISQSTDIQNIFIQYHGLQSLLGLLKPQQNVNVNDETKLRKIVLCLITHICMDNIIIQNELYQLDGIKSIIDCMSDIGLLMYAVKAITVLTYQNQQITQYLINQISVPTLNNPTQHINIIPLLIQCMSGHAVSLKDNIKKDSINDQLSFAACIASLCTDNTQSSLTRSIADKLLRNPQSTETINKLCNHLKQMQKQQQQQQQQTASNNVRPITTNVPSQSPQAAPQQQQLPLPVNRSMTPPNRPVSNNSNPSNIRNLPLPDAASVRPTQ